MWAVTKALNQPKNFHPISTLFKTWHQWFLILPLLMSVDVVSIFSAHWLAYVLRMNYLPFPLIIPPAEIYWKLALFLGFTSPLLFALVGLYKNNLAFSLFSEWTYIFLGVSVLSLFEFTTIFFFRDLLPYKAFTFSRLTAVLSWFLSLIFILTGRSLIRLFQRLLRQKLWGVKRVLIIGSTPLATTLMQQKQEYLGRGYAFIAIHDSLLSPKEIEQLQIDTLIYTEPPSDQLTLQNLTTQCQTLGLQLFLWPNLTQMATAKIHLTEIAGLPLIHVQHPPLRSLLHRFSKRCFDLLMVSIILVLSLPFMACIALLIKLTSAGPIFYRQERVSRDGKSFQMFKFRTMPVNSEASTGPVWAKANDQRPTAIGGFLRRSSLDELPQLFNVLKGEMSLVGPRPERPFFVKQFEEKILNYPERHLVKAGITGWAQINGWRGDTSLEERIKCDLYYIKNWNLLFDIRIILKSFWIVLRDYLQKRAY